MPAGALARGAAVATLLAASASAQDSFWVVYNGATLYDVDVSAMTATRIGPLGVAGVGGIAMANDGTLYAIAASTDDLYTVDETTGMASLAVSLGAGFDLSMGMAIDPTTDRLYAASSAYAGYASDIVEIDRLTGTLTPIVSTSFRCFVGLDFDDTGSLFGIDGCPPDELVGLDLATGIETVPTPGGLTSWPFLSNFAFGSSGVMYGLHNDGRMLVIDRVTGYATPLGVPLGMPFGMVTGMTAKEPARELLGNPSQLSVSSGGVQTLLMFGGFPNAGKSYLVAGSVSGTSPGFTYTGMSIPLNPDAYTVFSILSPGVHPLYASAGVLDSMGQAAITFTLFPASDPGFVGLTLNHAGVVLELISGSLTVTFVTNAAPCLLVP